MKWLLRFYPRSWRERYEEEMQALLEQHHPTWRTGLDLLLGACEAQLDWVLRRRSMTAFSRNSHPFTLAKGTLAGTIVVVALLLYLTLSCPVSIQGAGLIHFVLSLTGLLTFAGIALWSVRQTTTSIDAALAQGAKFGILVGFGAWVNMALEHFAPLNATASIVRGVGMWAWRSLCFWEASVPCTMLPCWRDRRDLRL